MSLPHQNTYRLLLCAIALAVVNIFGGAQASAAAVKRASENNLTHEFAKFRRAQVESVKYYVLLHFTATDEKYFKGNVLMDVKLKDTKSPLSIDFLGKSVEMVRVNHKAVKVTHRTGSFDIAAKDLALENRIDISYFGAFKTDGYGFQRTVDTEDKSVYIYSDSEPYHAHTVMPCLDQPDLKATYTLKVTAPTEWKVISNDLVERTEAREPGMTETRFYESKPISPYLFFVGMGPFVEWTDSYNGLPLTLYARKTIAKHVDTARIFEATKKGLKFFNEYFGTPYPFPKYGQLFIPEFAWGGMENPGAVTLNERNIFRGPRPVVDFENRDDLILHEMAHMWFGDLVTMQWWDDLWLNESFASYLAFIASERAMKATGASLGWIGDKSWGYWQDQLVTTHPIETKVIDTRTALGNFDGITYAKGAASLRQLHFFVGEEAFRAGLNSYFKKYAFKNTTRADFINEIATAAKTDLEPWTKAWLQTAGPNRVQAKWTCGNDKKLSAFLIEQKPSVSKTLSPHKTRVATFKLNGKKLKLLKTQDVAYTTASTPVPELVGTECPDLVFPNYDDNDYALFSFDKKSLEQASAIITMGVESTTMRLATWQMLGQMVRDGELSLKDYFQMAFAGLKAETDEDVYSNLPGRVRSHFYGYADGKMRDTLAPDLENIVFTRLSDASAKSSLQMVLFNFYVSIAHTKAAQQRLLEYLQNQGLPKGFELDQDRRWSVIRQLSLNGYPEVEKLIAAEEIKDPSTTGKRAAYAARVAFPDQSAKKKFWTALQAPDKIPFSTLRASTQAFNNPNNVELSQSYVEPFFKRVATMNWGKNDNLVEIYFENLFPQNVCSKDLLVKSEKTMKSASGKLTSLARRAWLEANEELAKCLLVRSRL